jgi:hypothetical protein
LNEKEGEPGLNRTTTGVSTVSTEPGDYPGGAKLALITFALCLSVFCMALVSTIYRYS